MALSNAARRRLAALRATGVPVHTDAELERQARDARPTSPVAAAARPAARRAARPRRTGLGPCGVNGCVNGCHDCE